MSPRGFWDDDVNPAGVRLAPQISQAELAARLGSIHNFDRMGEVIFLDGFEHGIAHWELDASGVGAAAVLSAATSKNGAYSLELTSPSNLTQAALARRSFPFEELGIFGIEASFTLDPTGDLGPPNSQVVLLRLDVWDGTSRYQARLELDASDGQLSVITTGGSYTDIGSTRGLWAGSYVFNTLKLVVDAANGVYRRVRLNGTTLSPTTTALNVTASSATPAVRLQFGIDARGVFNRTTYWDDIILTQNEP